jgi:hypothetical protein
VSNELIDRLATDLRPTPRGLIARRLLVGALAGGVVSAALVAATLGFRHDLGDAVGDGMFWMKLGYTFSLAALALWACERLARPAGLAMGRLPWLLAPVAVLAALGAWWLAQVPAGERLATLLGHSAGACPWLIVAFSLPPLLGLIWATRALAPTRLRLAGLVLGLAAGGVGATAYAFHCDEMAAPFLAIWYSAGILGAGLIGALLGPRALRW